MDVREFFNVGFVFLQFGKAVSIDTGVDDDALPVDHSELLYLVVNLGHYLHLKFSDAAAFGADGYILHGDSGLLGGPQRFDEGVLPENSGLEVSEDLVLVLTANVIEQFVSGGEL